MIGIRGWGLGVRDNAVQLILDTVNTSPRACEGSRPDDPLADDVTLRGAEFSFAVAQG